MCQLDFRPSDDSLLRSAISEGGNVDNRQSLKIVWEGIFVSDNVTLKVSEVVPALTARAQLGQILDRVSENGECFLITNAARQQPLF